MIELIEDAVFIDIEPMGKPRMTQRDKWMKRPAVMRYRAFCDELRLKFKKKDFTGISLTFHIATPPSWSKKKAEAHIGKPHKQKPDIDNMVKSVLDALLVDGDEKVWKVCAFKVWSEKSGISILVE